MTDSSIAVPRHTQSAIEAAVIWWVMALRTVKLDDGRTHRDLIIRALQRFVPHPEEALEKFDRALTKRLEALLDAVDDSVELKVGHHPGGVLYEAGQQAGLNFDIISWPWCTTMTVTHTQVSVSHGFNDPETVIWSK